MTPTENVGAVEVAAEEKGKKGKKEVKIKARKKKAQKTVTIGCVYVQATYNNTIVTVTDQNGNVLSWSSAGKNGFKGAKKATPFAASVITRDAIEKAKACGLKDAQVFVKGVGMGREAAVRAINANGLNVLSIQDVTPIPHNGCRKPRPRKV